MLVGIDYTGIAVCFVCHDGNGNFLMHKRSQNCRDQKGKWDCGGGKLEFGETIEEGLMRELEEEYGCQGEINESLPATSYIISENNKKFHWIALIHVVEVNRDEVKNNEPHSIDEIGWFKLDQLPEPLHEGFKRDSAIHMDTLKKYAK